METAGSIDAVVALLVQEVKRAVVVTIAAPIVASVEEPARDAVKGNANAGDMPVTHASCSDNNSESAHCRLLHSVTSS